MPPLATLARTGAFAWGSSAAHLPILATGTASGALDDTFDQGGRLELWSVFGGDPSVPSPSASSTTGGGAAPQSPVKAKKAASKKEPSASGDDFDFGDDDADDGFVDEVSKGGLGEDGQREPVRSFRVKARCVAFLPLRAAGRLRCCDGRAGLRCCVGSEPSELEMSWRAPLSTAGSALFASPPWSRASEFTMLTLFATLPVPSRLQVQQAGVVGAV